MAKLTVWTRFAAQDQTTAVARKITGSITRMGTAASRITGLLRTAAIALTAGTIGKTITDFASRADDIADVAKRIGLSAQSLQELQFAAGLADISAEDLTGILQKMNNNLGQLRIKTGTLYAQLSKTNPALAKQLRTVKNSDEAFTLLMDAIAKETNVQKRAALAQAAFGRSGQEVIDMAADLNEKRRQARASGTIISDRDVENAAAMHVSLLRLKASGMGILNNVLGRLAQKLAPLLEKWSAWIEANHDLIGQRIDRVVDGITNAVTKAYEIFKKLNDLNGGHLLRNLLLVVGAWKAIRTGIIVAEAAQKLFNLTAGRMPVPAGGAVPGAAGAAGGVLGAMKFLPGIGAAAIAGQGVLPMLTKPAQAIEAARSGQNMEGGNILTNLFTRAAGLGMQLREKMFGGGQESHVTVDFKNMPEGVTASAKGTGVTLNRGPAFAAGGVH